MRKIISTLNIFLRQEWISVGVYFMATALFFFMIFNMGLNENRADFSIEALTMISMLSFFVGIYIGSGFLKLQQSHLWRIHQGYRSNLIFSLLSGAFIYGLIQFFPLLYAGWSWYIAIIAPTCITLLAAQLVIGNNLLMKFILPATPFILFQLRAFEIDNNLILMLLILFTSLAIYVNADNDKKISKSTQSLLSGNMQQQIKSAPIQKFNNMIADLFHLVNAPIAKKTFSIALIQPANRFGLSSAIVALFCLIVINFIGDKKIEIEAFASFLLGSMILGLYIESKLLVRQLKSISHTFSRNKHNELKNKILSTFQKQIASQVSLFLILSLVANLIIGDFIDPLLMIKMGLSVAIIASVFVPLMLCLNWFNINFKLLIVVLIYAATNLFLSGWQYQHKLVDLISFPALLVIVGLVLARQFFIFLLKRQSVEQFMRVYG